jgi:hypothetical protein
VWHPWEERLEPPAVTDDLGTTHARWADAEAGDFRAGYGLSREATLAIGRCEAEPKASWD